MTRTRVAEVRWDAGADYEMTLEGVSAASPRGVYETLANPSTHLEWAGRRQYPGFRLLAIEEAGPLEAGTEFASVGSIPMALARWENSNEVTEARGPEVLELHTRAVVVWRSGKRTEARYEHRYEIASEGAGSRVVYRLRQTELSHPPLRMRLPLMRTLTHRVMIPLLCRRGFANLLHEAELGARARATNPSADSGT